MTWVTEELQRQLESWVLVVGAGGIGCEVLKNLALTGFRNIVVIDLDTIDISNLNRQFLFRKEHVGKSKAEVAAAAVKGMRPEVNIEYYHDSIMSEKYDVSFFQRFTVVMSALDNRSARSHVNRLCLAAKVPLIESGSAGYLGQVGVILKGKTECYDCVPKQEGKTYPGCTIRNTPSEPIHCVLWAKSLFNQLFGEADPDDDVSPDATDEEAKTENGTSAEEKKDGPEAATNGDSNSNSSVPEPKHISTRQLAEAHDYDPKMLFDKLFFGDINYLLSMANLWKQRRQPVPLTWDIAIDQDAGGSSKLPTANEMWSLAKWAEVYEQSVTQLAERFMEASKKNGILTWDKDDDPAMNFVAACANIRAHIFHIPTKSLFDIKAMAGNIIPAIATTNACVAGMLVVEALKVVRQQLDKIRWVFISRKPNPRGKILVDGPPEPPRPNCYVCSEKREVYVSVNVDDMLLKTFQAKVLKQALSMLAPDATDVLSSRVVISSEEGETDAIMDHTLAKLGLRHGSQLDCDDFQQQLNLKVVVFHDSQLKPDDYKLVSDSSGTSEEGNGHGDEHMDAENGSAAAAVNGDAVVKSPDGASDAEELKRKRKSMAADEPSTPKRSRVDVD